MSQEGDVSPTSTSSPTPNTSPASLSQGFPSLHQEGDSPKQHSKPKSTKTTKLPTTPTSQPSSSSISNPLPMTTRTQRSTRGNWKDGPAIDKNATKMGYFETVRERSIQGLHTEIVYQALLMGAFNPSQATPCGPFTVEAMKASLKKALKDTKRRPEILKSIDSEIDNLEQPGVLKSLRLKDIPKECLKDIIGVYMFHKEKYKDGVFDKDKFRLVLLSNLRDPNSIGDSICPTVNPISVMTQLNLAAVSPETVIAAYDIKGAFLMTPMKPDVRMYIRVSPDVVQHWIRHRPERAHMVEADGCLYFQLERYVYGLHESSREFNDMLDKRLKSIGFQPSKADPCLYIKKVPGGRIIVSTHVDDMLLTAPTVRWRTWFEVSLRKYFQLVEQYDDVFYLGMRIKRDKYNNINVDQFAYLSALVKKYNFEKLKKFPNTPATDTLTLTSDGSPACNRKDYLSLVMALMYAARFTRPDINMAVSYLATRSHSATVDDLGKLLHILKYIAGTINDGLQFRSDIPFRPVISADASHHIHTSGHGQQAMIITNGSAPVAHRSVKIKMITRSSSESELVALEEASTYAPWYILLLYDLGVTEITPIPIYQDNKSTIIMAVSGGSFKRTKHLIGKASYVKERIDAKEIKLKYLASKDMPADLLTKPVNKAVLNHLKQLLFVVPVR